MWQMGGMGMQPVVSVTMPVFNGAATVARAVASIRAQTLTDWELVVVDDGSTDETAGILAELARAEPRLRVLRQEHAGVAVAANRALAAACGRYLARMDADDESYPERLDAQAAFLDAPENAGVGVVGGRVEFGGDRAAQAGYALHVDWVNALVTPEAMALNRFVEAPLANPSVMFRRGLVEAYGGYRDGDFPEDYELWLRWLAAGVRMAKVPQTVLRWHDSPGRLTRTEGRYRPEAFFRVKAEWIARWLKEEGVVVSGGGGGGGGDADGVGEGRKIFVWGAGRHTRKRAAHLEAHGVRIEGYVDVDAKKATPALGGTGRPVLVYTELPRPGELFVLGYVTSRGAREFIHAALKVRGYVEGRDFLMCA